MADVPYAVTLSKSSLTLAVGESATVLVTITGTTPPGWDGTNRAETSDPFVAMPTPQSWIGFDAYSMDLTITAYGVGVCRIAVLIIGDPAEASLFVAVTESHAPPTVPNGANIGNGQTAAEAIGNGFRVTGSIGNEANPSGAIGNAEYVA